MAILFPEEGGSEKEHSHSSYSSSFTGHPIFAQLLSEPRSTPSPALITKGSGSELPVYSDFWNLSCEIYQWLLPNWEEVLFKTQMSASSDFGFPIPILLLLI